MSSPKQQQSVFPSKTMKAFVYDPAAPAEDNFMAFRDDVAVPSPPKDDPKAVPIRVIGASINPLDYKLPKIPMVGYLFRNYFGKLRPVGFDVCGEVLQDCYGFSKGDVVMGPAASGALAEYAYVSGHSVARVPKDSKLSLTSAAGIFVAACTSMKAFQLGGFQAGQHVAVIGASGGTGSYAVQIAKALGASKVTAVCSTRNVDLVKSLGADVVVDYSKGETLKSVLGEKCVDLVYDCVTSPEDPDYEPQAREVMKDTAKLVQINTMNPIDWFRAALRTKTGWSFLYPKDKELFLLGGGHSETLEKLRQWTDEGKIKDLNEVIEPTVLKFGPKTCLEAYQLLKSRRARGKIVLEMQQQQ